MKIPAVALLLSLCASAIAWTQERPRVRRVPTPPSVTTGKAQARPAGGQIAAPRFLNHNLSVSLSGSFGDKFPMEITLSGCSQNLQADTMLGFAEIAEQRIPILGTVNYILEQTDAGYLVSYSVGVRTPISTSVVATGSDKVSTNISFQNVSMAGTVRCIPGEPVEIFRSGESILTLKVTAAKPVAPDKAGAEAGKGAGAEAGKGAGAEAGRKEEERAE